MTSRAISSDGDVLAGAAAWPSRAQLTRRRGDKAIERRGGPGGGKPKRPAQSFKKTKNKKKRPGHSGLD